LLQSSTEEISPDLSFDTNSLAVRVETSIILIFS
jgi:hypothetical protein